MSHCRRKAVQFESAAVSEQQANDNPSQSTARYVHHGAFVAKVDENLGNDEDESIDGEELEDTDDQSPLAKACGAWGILDKLPNPQYHGHIDVPKPRKTHGGGRRFLIGVANCRLTLKYSFPKLC